MDTISLTINRAAQNLMPFEETQAWFALLGVNEQRKVLDRLRYFVIQSHPTKEEAAQAIQQSGLRKTFTPCVLIMRFEMVEALGRIVQLPADEQAKSFRLLLKVFAIADERRRLTQCVNGCTHEWHNLPE